jgi:hypothetical protein
MEVDAHAVQTEHGRHVGREPGERETVAGAEEDCVKLVAGPI